MFPSMRAAGNVDGSLYPFGNWIWKKDGNNRGDGGKHNKKEKDATRVPRPGK